MLRSLVALSLVAASGPAWACSMEGVQASPEQVEAVEQADGAHATLAISGMKCGNCVKKVQAALESVDGVLAVAVDLPGGTARVAFDAGKTSAEKLAEVVSGAGYEARVQPQS